MYEIFKQSKLFHGLPEQEVKNYYNQSPQITLHKGEMVFLEEDIPARLYLLIGGKVEIAKNTLAGNKIIITTIETSGELFGEIYLFMEKEHYDVHARALEASTIIGLPRCLLDEGSALLQKNLMQIFAGKAFYLNQKVKILGCASLREKIVRYLFYLQQADGSILGNLQREEMAEYLNVARPSLSRELGNMQKEGIVKIEGRDILITNQREFEKYL